MKPFIAGLFLSAALVVLSGCAPQGAGSKPMSAPNPSPTPPDRASTSTNVTTVTKTEAEWRAQLTSEQFQVLREAGTERPYGKAYEEFKEQGGGTYYCAGCNAELFSSDHKFDSHCGWPSFYDPANAKNVKQIVDKSHGMERVEVRCAVCDGHLGHVFKGEGFKTPTDLRYCINGVALKFVPKDKAAAKK